MLALLKSGQRLTGSLFNIQIFAQVSAHSGKIPHSNATPKHNFYWAIFNSLYVSEFSNIFGTPVWFLLVSIIAMQKFSSGPFAHQSRLSNFNLHVYSTGSNSSFHPGKVQIPHAYTTVKCLRDVGGGLKLCIDGCLTRPNRPRDKYLYQDPNYPAMRHNVTMLLKIWNEECKYWRKQIPEHGRLLPFDSNSLPA